MNAEKTTEWRADLVSLEGGRRLRLVFPRVSRVAGTLAAALVGRGWSKVLGFGIWGGKRVS